jgi:NADH:ubiquinone oxidoreductase subunit 5 (subunit L)/multisubunit Na+/H+ antiporter MnhA subunit
VHGIIKAKSFFCAGGFISCYGSQDIRYSGNSAVYLKSESFFFILSLSQLGCFPGTIGFLLKDYYFNLFFEYFNNFLGFNSLFVSVVFGLLYIFKVFYYIVYDLYKNIRLVYPQYLLVIIVTVGEYFFGQLNYIIVTL